MSKLRWQPEYILQYSFMCQLRQDMQQRITAIIIGRSILFIFLVYVWKIPYISMTIIICKTHKSIFMKSSVFLRVNTKVKSFIQYGATHMSFLNLDPLYNIIRLYLFGYRTNIRICLNRPLLSIAAILMDTRRYSTCH